MIIGFKKIVPSERAKFLRTRIGVNYALVTKRESRWNMTTTQATRLLFDVISGHKSAYKVSECSNNGSNIAELNMSEAKRSIILKTPVRAFLANVRKVIDCTLGKRICIEVSAFKYGNKEGKRIYAAIYGTDEFFEANTKDTFLGKPLESIDSYFFTGNSALAPYRDENGRYHAFIFDINSSNFDKFGQQKKIKRFLRMVSAKSMIVCPIYTGANLEGVIYIPLRIKEKKLSHIKEKLLTRIEQECQQVAFTIEKNGITGEGFVLNALLERVRWFKRPFIRIIDAGTDIFSLYLEAVRQSFERSKEREKSILEHLDSLTKISEINDAYTGGHNARVGKYAVAIVEVLREIQGKDILSKIKDPWFYSDIIYVDNFFIELAGKYHDIGKVGISSNILRYPGKLTEGEKREMKQHPKLGKELYESLIRGFIPEFPEEAVQLGLESIYKHHERFDGQGYPTKANYLDIPVITRIIAIADSFDAMTSKRSYQENKTEVEALTDLIGWIGIKYDPFLLWCFIKALAKGVKVGFQEEMPYQFKKLRQTRGKAIKRKEQILQEMVRDVEKSLSWHEKTVILKNVSFERTCTQLLEKYLWYFSVLERIEQTNMENIIKAINEQMLQAAINNADFPFVEAIKCLKDKGINYERYLRELKVREFLTEKEYNKLRELNLI